MVYSLSALTNINLLFKTSIVNISLTHSHSFVIPLVCPSDTEMFYILYTNSVSLDVYLEKKKGLFPFTELTDRLL